MRLRKSQRSDDDLHLSVVQLVSRTASLGFSRSSHSSTREEESHLSATQASPSFEDLPSKMCRTGELTDTRLGLRSLLNPFHSFLPTAMLPNGDRRLGLQLLSSLEVHLRTSSSPLSKTVSPRRSDPESSCESVALSLAPDLSCVAKEAALSSASLTAVFLRDRETSKVLALAFLGHLRRSRRIPAGGVKRTR